MTRLGATVMSLHYRPALTHSTQRSSQPPHLPFPSVGIFDINRSDYVLINNHVLLRRLLVLNVRGDRRIKLMKQLLGSGFSSRPVNADDGFSPPVPAVT